MTPSDDLASPGALRNWTGCTETRRDAFTAAPLAGLSALLDRVCDPAPQPVTPLPPLAHWLYFLPQAAQREKEIQRIFSSFCPRGFVAIKRFDPLPPRQIHA